jgi:CheY-like chemotaxis protein
MATVLIVEDEELIRELTESYLQEHGHQTISVGKPDEALAVLGIAAHIDVMLTDIGLYSDSSAGLTLAQRAVQRRPNLKVLYATGQAVTDGMKTMFVQGSGLLPKPYTNDQLQKALVKNFGIGDTGLRVGGSRPLD